MKFVQVNETDKARLFDLHKQALGSYVDQIYGWDDSEQEEFFNQKFDTSANKWIIVDRAKVGVIKYRDNGDHFYIDNIEIYPEHQGKGFGSAAINSVLSKAGRRNVNAELQVFKINPAARLYKRLGFQKIGETETHLQMRWVSNSIRADCAEPRA
ncbi:MAG: GNAT family N-acetyltransferase [Chloroflexi bacterium]|nr:GNAT family N-acetyltransferase [Chloroflexota bacterium]